MKNSKVTEFIDKLGSKEPTPGGGAAAGVAAGMGVGAILMAMKFSNTKSLEESQQELLEKHIKSLEKSKEKFVDIIDRDATDFGPLSNAYAMPRDTEEEKNERSEAIQEGLVIASQPPIDLLNEAVTVVSSVKEVLPYIKKGIISDIGVGLQLLRSAMLSSSLNIYINARSLKDEEQREQYFDETDKTLTETIADIDELFTQVNETIRPND